MSFPLRRPILWRQLFNLPSVFCSSRLSAPQTRLDSRLRGNERSNMPTRLGLLRKETMGDARRALRQVGGAFAAGRRQPRTPARQRLMRRREPLEHFEVLAAAEPFAQPFCLLGPHPAEARP